MAYATPVLSCPVERVADTLIPQDAPTDDSDASRYSRRTSTLDVRATATFRVVHSTPDMAEALEALQRRCFPSLAEDQRTTARYHRWSMNDFPKGQLAVLDGKGEVVAFSSDLLAAVDLVDYKHRCDDVFTGHWPTIPVAQEWLYGSEIGVDPDYQGMGLSKLLYKARHALVRRLNLRGHAAGGMLVGYAHHKHHMSAQSYLDKVVRGELFDPTVSVQMRRGFKVYGLLPNYVTDPACDNNAAFIVWHNPDYQPTHTAV